jgi:hypothetical protein
MAIVTEESKKAAAPTEKSTGVTVISDEVKGNGTTLVANHHTAAIMLPRSGAIGMNIHPIVLNPGHATPLDTTEWNERKKCKTLQYYLDHGLLSEVTHEGAVAVTEVTTGNALPPANLQTEAEKDAQTGAGTAGIKAAVVKEKTANVEMS